MASFSGLGSSSSLPCVYVCLVGSCQRHDWYKIKAVNVSLTGSIAICGSNSTIFCLPTKAFFKPKSISFVIKTRQDCRTPQSESLTGSPSGPFLDPIYFSFPAPHLLPRSPVPAFSPQFFQSAVCSESTRKMKTNLKTACRLRTLH